MSSEFPLCWTSQRNPIPAGASSLIWTSINRDTASKTFYQSMKSGWKNIKWMTTEHQNCLNNMKKKKKKVLGEYWEAVCFHPVLDLPVKTRGRKIKKHLVREDWIPLSILTGSAGETLMTWNKRRMDKPMSVPRCQWLLHTRWLGGTKTAEVRTTLKRQSAHTPDQHHNSCSTSSNCNLLAGWDLLEHLSETFTPIPTSGTRLH